ncbi:hypothetical protein [Methylocella sp.]|uniref:hypothetical protein n=1 Tax=Methylocella sp. TaxID=1978226 RepID=UPI0037831613
MPLSREDFYVLTRTNEDTIKNWTRRGLFPLVGERARGEYSAFEALLFILVEHLSGEPNYMSLGAAADVVRAVAPVVKAEMTRIAASSLYLAPEVLPDGSGTTLDLAADCDADQICAARVTFRGGARREFCGTFGEIACAVEAFDAPLVSLTFANVTLAATILRNRASKNATETRVEIGDGMYQLLEKSRGGPLDISDLWASGE